MRARKKGRRARKKERRARKKGMRGMSRNGILTSFTRNNWDGCGEPWVQ